MNIIAKQSQNVILSPPSSNRAYKGLRETFSRFLGNNPLITEVDLSQGSIISKADEKLAKKFLPLFIEEQKEKRSILLKVSTQYTTFLKHALDSGFKFQQATAETATLIYRFNHPNPVETGVYNPKEQTRKDILVDNPEKSAKVPKLPPPLDTSFLSSMYSRSDWQSYREKITKLNPNRAPEVLFKNEAWDIEKYNRKNYPIILGELESKTEFSFKRNSLGLRFLDMPIHIPGKGWVIPPELEQFKEVIQKAAEFERSVNPDFDEQCYVYITVDQKTVGPGEAQRRTGWHGDSWMPIDIKKDPLKLGTPCEHVYVVADQCPTPFDPGPFSMEGVNPENVDEFMARLAQTADNNHARFYPNYTLLRLNPYCVHNVGFNNSSEPIFRTFVKITIGINKKAELGNALNPYLLKLDWSLVPRRNVPYTNEALKDSAHRPDGYKFTEVNPHTIDFSSPTCPYDWTEHKIGTAIKTATVKGRPAKVGEMVESRVDGDLRTIRVAEEGFWQISTGHEDVYVCSKEQLDKFYEEDPNCPGRFIPKRVERRFVFAAEDVRFMASWGTLVYAKKGDVIACVNKNDIYAIPRQEFDEGFLIV